MIKKGITWDRIFLVTILALAGFLSLYDIWNQGYSNNYYAAAVKSMLTSFHNFFFASFDGGGYVSVDKPPLGLWIQTAAALVLGFQGWVLILPQALASVISTALVYHLVRRTFGTKAGLIAALAFALTPILVAVSRTNNFDSMVVLVVLLAAWAAIVAAERGSLKLLLLSVALVGLGFNIKMLQAFMVLPAIYLLYTLSPALTTRKKIGHLAVATVLLLVVALSWAVVVDLTPADFRPYVGSSQTNSVIELALGYNGIERVTGMQFNAGHIGNDTPLGPGADMLSDPSGGGFPGANVTGGGFPGAMPGNGTMPGGMGGFGGEGGAEGVFRLFNQQLAGQISWLLPLAIMGFFAAIITLRKSKDEGSRNKVRQALFWGMWMLPMLGYFSIAGFFHRYYLVMLAPSIAALCAIGLTQMWKAYQGRGLQSLMLPVSLLITALFQAYFIVRYTAWSGWLALAICPVSVTAALILIFAKFDRADLFKGIVKPLIICACAVLLIAPALWSLTPLIYPGNSQIPYAGPELNTGSLFRGSLNLTGSGQGMPSMGSFMGEGNSGGMIDFLLDHYDNQTFLVAVPSAMQAASIILETGKPVMAVGGFLGSDPILTTDRLAQMVADGELRYFLLSGGMGGPGGGNQSTIDTWVKEHGTLVSDDEWSGAVNTSGAGGFASGQLYDLKGGNG